MTVSRRARLAAIPADQICLRLASRRTTLDATANPKNCTPESKSLMNCSIFVASSVRTAILLLASSATQIAAAQASLIGDQIFIDRIIPAAAGGPFSYCQDVAGSGPEGCAVTVAEGDSDRIALTNGNNFYVNVEAFQIRFELGPESGGGGPFDEHFIIFDDLDFLNTSQIISGLTFDTDLVGMDASRISFSDHRVVVNYANINYPGGAYLILTLETAPEPAALALAVVTCLCLATRQRYARALLAV